MNEIHVLFADGGETSIVAAFGCPQDAAGQKPTTMISASDSRWASYWDSLPDGVKPLFPKPKAAA
jgi:hypothetical protein